MTDHSQRLSCGQAQLDLVEAKVELRGWVHRRRDHGGLIFLDLRDHEGITQLVVDPAQPEIFALAESLRSEDVIGVVGVVRARPSGTQNERFGDWTG